VNAEPPRRAERILDWSLTDAERGAVMGDMQEEFADLAQRLGPAVARRWYWRQTVVSVWPNLLRRWRGDARRRKRFYWGLAKMLFGLPGLLLTLSAPRPFQWVGGAGFLLYGASDIARAFAQRRRCGANPQMMALLLVWISVDTAANYLPASTATWWLCAAGLAAGVVIALWPKWPDLDPHRYPPSVFCVRPRTDSVFERAKRFIAVVPNVPLGQSPLILGQAPPAGAAPSRGVPLDEMIFGRTFAQGARVRLYAAANSVSADTRATVDLIDANGCTAKAITATPMAGGLELSMAPGTPSFLPEPDIYDEGQESASQRIGEIDVVLDLADLKPGTYNVRLTVHDGAQSSVQQDGFVVTR
jgi:hypothetical protein